MEKVIYFLESFVRRVEIYHMLCRRSRQAMRAAWKISFSKLSTVYFSRCWLCFIHVHHPFVRNNYVFSPTSVILKFSNSNSRLRRSWWIQPSLTEVASGSGLTASQFIRSNKQKANIGHFSKNWQYGKGVCPQKYGTLESEWDSQEGLQPLTRKFQIFANKVSTNMTMIFYVNISTIQSTKNVCYMIVMNVILT